MSVVNHGELSLRGFIFITLSQKNKKKGSKWRHHGRVKRINISTVKFIPIFVFNLDLKLYLLLSE